MKIVTNPLHGVMPNMSFDQHNRMRLHYRNRHEEMSRLLRENGGSHPDVRLMDYYVMWKKSRIHSLAMKNKVCRMSDQLRIEEARVELQKAYSNARNKVITHKAWKEYRQAQNRYTEILEEEYPEASRYCQTLGQVIKLEFQEFTSSLFKEKRLKVTGSFNTGKNVLGVHVAYKTREGVWVQTEFHTVLFTRFPEALRGANITLSREIARWVDRVEEEEPDPRDKTSGYSDVVVYYWDTDLRQRRVVDSITMSYSSWREVRFSWLAKDHFVEARDETEEEAEEWRESSARRHRETMRRLKMLKTLPDRRR